MPVFEDPGFRRKPKVAYLPLFRRRRPLHRFSRAAQRLARRGSRALSPTPTLSLESWVCSMWLTCAPSVFKRSCPRNNVPCLVSVSKAPTLGAKNCMCATPPVPIPSASKLPMCGNRFCGVSTGVSDVSTMFLDSPGAELLKIRICARREITGVTLTQVPVDSISDLRIKTKFILSSSGWGWRGPCGTFRRHP
jgi:hypothetical protein